MPFEPFLAGSGVVQSPPPPPGSAGSGTAGPVGPVGSSSASATTAPTTPTATQSAQSRACRAEREMWEAARSQPKRDFTVYQRVPERKRMPYKRLLPRLRVLSTPPLRYRVKPADSDWDPFKVSERAKKAVASEWLEKLARPKSRLDSRQ